MTYQLTNLTVVTGASSGIGAEIARRLAARKARLLLTGRGAGRLRAVADSLDPAAPAAELVTADLADPAGLDTLVAAIAGRPVDLLVNDAGCRAKRPQRSWNCSAQTSRWASSRTRSP